ncbi:YqzL family protein [Virgibacillus oceani]
MIDFTWKVFSQTGNIETYLLMKQIENDNGAWNEKEIKDKEVHSVDSKM